MRGVRTMLAAAALGAALLAAGCTDSTGSSSGGSSGNGAKPATSAPATGSGGTATGADKQVCTDTEKLVNDSTKKFGEEAVKALQSGSVAEGEQKAIAAIKTLFAEWAQGLRKQADKASNPDLKGALTSYATGLEKVNSQISTTADLAKLQDLNTPEIESATDKIAQICG